MAPVEDSQPWQDGKWFKEHGAEQLVMDGGWAGALFQPAMNKWSFLSLIERGRPARALRRQSLAICFIKMHFYVIGKIKKKLVLLIGEIRKIKFIMQTALANEVYFGIHTAYVVQER